jgi:hypothetical protein
MSENGTRFAEVVAAIDAANAHDPNTIEIDGQRVAAELVYGQRMSETLARLAPEASEALRIAARGQHIERWTSPRRGYPEGRVGYLRWRKDLQAFHAARVGEIMTAAGYDAAAIGRVGALIRKERLKADAEAQTLEDVACLVFLAHISTISCARPITTSSPASWRRPGTRCLRSGARRRASSPCPRRCPRCSSKAWRDCGRRRNDAGRQAQPQSHSLAMTKTRPR